MAGLTIAFDGRNLRGDFVLGPSGLATGDDLKTNIVTSLFTDPGWWANAYEPDTWGCRLFELRRAKHTQQTLLRARDYCRQALQWLITDRIANKVDVATEWQGSLLAIGIVITRAAGVTRFSFVWDGIS